MLKVCRLNHYRYQYCFLLAEALKWAFSHMELKYIFFDICMHV